MAIVDIDNMYYEMLNTMKNNFKGTPTNRFNQARKQFLESVKDSINQNKKGLIKEFKEDEQ